MFSLHVDIIEYIISISFTMFSISYRNNCKKLTTELIYRPSKPSETFTYVNTNKSTNSIPELRLASKPSNTSAVKNCLSTSNISVSCRRFTLNCWPSPPTGWPIWTACLISFNLQRMNCTGSMKRKKRKWPGIGQIPTWMCKLLRSTMRWVVVVCLILH